MQLAHIFYIFFLTSGAPPELSTRDCTIDVKVDNLEIMKHHLISLRKRWLEVHEVSYVAKALEKDDRHALKGIKRNMGDITADTYRINIRLLPTFYVDNKNSLPRKIIF